MFGPLVVNFPGLGTQDSFLDTHQNRVETGLVRKSVPLAEGQTRPVIPNTIYAETMERAIQVCLYFQRQYQMVMTNAGTTGIPEWVARLELKVETSRLDQITTSNLTRWRMAESGEDANEKIVMLVDELCLGAKKKNRQGNWVWLPHVENPNVAAAMA